MIKYFCDKCNKEVKLQKDLENTEFHTAAPMETHKVQLCVGCSKELKERRFWAQYKADSEFFADLIKTMFGNN